MMKKIFATFILIVPILAIAGNNEGSAVLSTYTHAITSWIPVMQKSAYWLFGTLAFIAFVLEFGFKLLNNDIELGSVMASLIKIILIFGLFKAFMDWQWIYEIFRSFQILGNKANAAAGVTTQVSVDTLTDSAFELMGAITDASSIFHPADSLALFFIGFVAVIAIIWLGVELLTTYVKFLIMWSLSPLFLALGVLNHTRQWALSAITATMGVALEYMLIKLVIGLSISTVKDYAKKAMDDDGSLFSLLIMALLISGLARMVHGIASSMFSGQPGANSSSGFQAARTATMAAAAGLVGGGMAAYSQVKEAAAAGDSRGGGKASTFAKVAAGAAAGATSGAIKGSLGFHTHNAGQKSGAAIGAGLNKAMSAMSSTANKSSKPSDVSDTSSSTKDRNGFDTSLLKSDSGDSSTGEIKGA
jgi:P-type conjugative transfer protein TrbL